MSDLDRTQKLTREQINALRLKAFASNSHDDRMAYYKACSGWFQDEDYRELARALPAVQPAPVTVEEAARVLLDDLSAAIPGNGELGDRQSARRWSKASDAAEEAPTCISRPTPIQMIRAALRALAQENPHDH